MHNAWYIWLVVSWSFSMLSGQHLQQALRNAGWDLIRNSGAIILNVLYQPLSNKSSLGQYVTSCYNQQWCDWHFQLKSKAFQLNCKTRRHGRELGGGREIGRQGEREERRDGGRMEGREDRSLQKEPRGAECSTRRCEWQALRRSVWFYLYPWSQTV